MQAERDFRVSRRWFHRASLAAAGGLLLAARPGNGAAICDYPALPVARTFDLKHVEPEHFAAALGSDPAAIFAFVRDQVSYEAYRGCLRGPRGTLLAMAGNSVDQAALLAALLEAAGQKNVRFVRGRLSQDRAEQVVRSMWQHDGRSRPAPAGEAAPADWKGMTETLRTGVRRDYELIRRLTKSSDRSLGEATGPSMEQLVEEARDHFWIRYDRDGQSVDLDPVLSRPPALRSNAFHGEELSALPPSLFHRVSIRVRLEENSGKLRSTRTTLQCDVSACDLSADDVMFGHMPENWNGPSTSLQSALRSALTDTGKIVPVLVFGDGAWHKGKPFRPQPAARIDEISRRGFGIGRVHELLAGGAGKAEPVATAEWIEFEFTSPGEDGRRTSETVVREIFDHLGKARSAAERELDDGQLRDLFSGTAPDVSSSVYGLFFTTGRLDGVHFQDLEADAVETNGGAVDVRLPMRRFGTLVAAASDGIAQQIGQRNPHHKICFYPDTPRLFITQFQAHDETCRIAFDLRHDRVRTAVDTADRQTAFAAQVFHGVLDGTLERVLLGRALPKADGEDGPTAPVSTSMLFELARAGSVAATLLEGGAGELGDKLSRDTYARLREEMDRRQLVIAPSHPLKVGSRDRFGWWSVNPQTGHTIAVTDDGLHSSTTEYVVIHDEEESYVFYESTYHGETQLKYVGSFARGTEEFAVMLHNITDNAFTLIEIVA